MKSPWRQESQDGQFPRILFAPSQTAGARFAPANIANFWCGPAEILMGVEPKIGVFPPKWMVKIMELSLFKWDDLEGFHPPFLEASIYPKRSIHERDEFPGCVSDESRAE